MQYLNIVTLMHLGWQRAAYPGRFFTSPKKLIAKALKIGYRGVMMLPTRGADGEEPDVAFYEDAWDFMPDAGLIAYLRQRRQLRECLIQWLVSPGDSECRRITARYEARDIPKIGHVLGDPLTRYVEIHSGLGLNLPRIFEALVEAGQRACFDTGHWLEMGLGVEEVRRIAGMVDVMHLNPADVNSYLEDKAERERHLRLLAEVQRVRGARLPVVVEYNPGIRALFDRHYSRNTAERMLHSIPS